MISSSNVLIYLLLSIIYTFICICVFIHEYYVYTFIYSTCIYIFVSERVSNPKQLRGGVRFVDSIPKTPSGKILRRVLRDRLKSKL